MSLLENLLVFSLEGSLCHLHEGAVFLDLARESMDVSVKLAVVFAYRLRTESVEIFEVRRRLAQAVFFCLLRFCYVPGRLHDTYDLSFSLCEFDLTLFPLILR